MAVGALVQRVDDFIPLKTFTIALAAFLTAAIVLVTVAGFMGTAPSVKIEKTVDIPTVETVAVKSGDLNQIDLTTPPPKPVTEAGKPQPRTVEDAVAGLSENSPTGLVPITRKEDGLTAFKAYASQFAANPNAKGTVSFVMVDFGLSAKVSTDVITGLPEGISFVINPYLKDAQKWTSSARKYNHEIWLSLPLQSKDYPRIDPGPNTILSQMGDSESNKRLLQSLGVATGYAGVMLDNASAFASAKENYQVILSTIADRGLGIIQSDPTDNITGSIVAQTKAPYAQGNIWINQLSSEKDLQAKFIDIEAAAVKDKKIIVLFEPYPVMIKAIQKWSAEATKRGIQLAPLSAVMAK